MGYVKEYWIGKEKRAKQAREHTRDMQERYGKDGFENIKREIEE